MIVILSASKKYVDSYHPYINLHTPYPIPSTGAEDLTAIACMINHHLDARAMYEADLKTCKSQPRQIKWYEQIHDIQQAHSDVKLTFDTDKPEVYLKMLANSQNSKQPLCTCPCGHVSSELAHIPHSFHKTDLQEFYLQQTDSDTSFGDDASLSSFSIPIFDPKDHSDKDEFHNDKTLDSNNQKTSSPISDISTQQSNEEGNIPVITSIPIIDLEVGSMEDVITNHTCNATTAVQINSLDWSAFATALSLVTRLGNMYKKAPVLAQNILPY